MGSRDAIARALMDLPAGVVRWASAPAERLPRVCTGVPGLDAALGGGWLKGRVSALLVTTTAATTGVTAIAGAAVAAVTARGRLAAWIDGDGSLDPESLAAAGADLERVLWVRGPLPIERVLSAAEEALRAGGFEVVVVRLPRGMRRSPDAGFVRLSRAAAGSRTAVLVTGTAAAVVPGAVTVRIGRAQARWAEGLPGAGALLLGASVVAEADGREVGVGVGHGYEHLRASGSGGGEG